jgi:hypothetical protein
VCRFMMCRIYFAPKSKSVFLSDSRTWFLLLHTQPTRELASEPRKQSSHNIVTCVTNYVTSMRHRRHITLTLCHTISYHIHIASHNIVTGVTHQRPIVASVTQLPKMLHSDASLLCVSGLVQHRYWGTHYNRKRHSSASDASHIVASVTQRRNMRQTSSKASFISALCVTQRRERHAVP